MPVNKNAIIRFNVLDKCFSNTGRKYFFDDLLREVNDALFEEDPKSTGIQIRQLREDIRFMKSDAGFAAPIEAYRVGKKAYYRYDDPNFSINKSPLNKTELDQLKSALAILQRFEGSPEFEWVNEIGPMLRDQFGLRESEEKIISYDSNIDYSGYEHIAPLFNAISNKQVLWMKFRSFQGEEFEYEFHPYHLKQYNNRWFVFGRNCPMDNNQWNVPLDRIVEFKEIDGAYIPNKTDWEDYFYDIIGVTKPLEGEVETVELEFSKDQAPYVKTKPIHPTQRASELEDGRLLVKIKVIPNYELEKTILGFGEQVKVLAPESLKISIKDRIVKSSLLY
jgi:predicted DNA-binding transcriptional regulator YafY